MRMRYGDTGLRADQDRVAKSRETPMKGLDESDLNSKQRTRLKANQN